MMPLNGMIPVAGNEFLYQGVTEHRTLQDTG